MAMTTSEHLQQAVDDLNARGVKTIVAVDPESSKHKSLYRQWQYILGEGDQVVVIKLRLSVMVNRSGGAVEASPGEPHFMRRSRKCHRSLSS